MEGTCLLALPEGILVEQIQITENGLLIEIVATSPTSCCPSCSQPSSSIHCHYRRTLRDVACAGRRVQLFLTVRKFSCCNPYCERHPSSPSVSPILSSRGPGRRSGSASRSPLLG
jgi:transposase